MIRWLLGRALAALLLAGMGSLAWSAGPDAVIRAPAVHAPTVATSQAEVGRAIYDGTLPGFDAQVRSARDDNMKMPAAQTACVSCHRPSGLGSFEGGLAVPPIAGSFLFRPFDGASTHRYPWPSTLRMRPAYSEANLHELLLRGHTPDGLLISAVMPRYDLSATQVAALAAHLRSLNTAVAPGVDETTVRFATITTPEVGADQVNELLGTLNRFFLQKNANTRGEVARRGSAQRNEQTMYRRHRHWAITHWALQGEPHTWAGQLEALYAREPVFAVLSGVGHQGWQPVHDFCRTQRVPCLLPTVAMPPEEEDFYSVYFSRGLVGQAHSAADALGQVPLRPTEVLVLAGATQTEQVQAAAVGHVLTRHHLKVRIAREWRAGDAVVSALPASAILARRVGPAGESPVFALAGMRPVKRDETGSAISSNATWITDQLHGQAAERQLVRARAWLRANGLHFSDDVIARNALMAATVAVESLVHVDESFSRDYCIEKLEHNLENMPALTAHPRLSIGPHQRFAAKTMMLVPMGDGAAGPVAAR